MPFRESQLRPSCQDALKPSDHQIGGQTDQEHERDGHHDILHLVAPEQQRNALRPKHQTALVLGDRYRCRRASGLGGPVTERPGVAS